MSVANRESGRLDRLICKVLLQCGVVSMEANLFVGSDNLPFDLLLGHPWQLRNKVSIDERKNGAYWYSRITTQINPSLRFLSILPKLFQRHLNHTGDLSMQHSKTQMLVLLMKKTNLVNRRSHVMSELFLRTLIQ